MSLLALHFVLCCSALNKPDLLLLALPPPAQCYLLAGVSRTIQYKSRREEQLNKKEKVNSTLAMCKAGTLSTYQVELTHEIKLSRIILLFQHCDKLSHHSNFTFWKSSFCSSPTRLTLPHSPPGYQRFPRPLLHCCYFHHRFSPGFLSLFRRYLYLWLNHQSY